MAAPWWIASHGGARDLALYGFSACAMTFIVMPALAPLADRLLKRRLIVIGLGLHAMVAVMLASLASFDLYHVPWALLAALLSALAGGFLMPAIMNAAAELVPSEILPEALSLQRSAQSARRLLGPALGGAAAAWSTGAALRLQAGLLASAELPAMRMSMLMPPERGWTLVNFVGVLFMFLAFRMLVPLKIKSTGLSGA